VTYTTHLIGTGKGCCRYNGAWLGDIKNVGVDECEAGCLVNEKCNFLSHSKAYKACALCSKCDLNSNKKGMPYDSWEMTPEATVVTVSVQEVSPPPASKLVGKGQGCCCYNGAQLGTLKNGQADSFAQCEAGCMAEEGCSHFSHNQALPGVESLCALLPVRPQQRFPWPSLQLVCNDRPPRATR
jgi:hypothetical protein